MRGGLIGGERRVIREVWVRECVGAWVGVAVTAAPLRVKGGGTQVPYVS